jgi:hypothetical protein
VALAGLAVVVAVGVVVLWPRPERITRERFQQIVAGMNQADVQAILGLPKDLTTRPTKILFMSGTVHRFDSYELWQCECADWICNAAYIRVIYSRSGTVVETNYCDCEAVAQNAFDNLVWRFKRQWHRWFP